MATLTSLWDRDLAYLHEHGRANPSTKGDSSFMQILLPACPPAEGKKEPTPPLPLSAVVDTYKLAWQGGLPALPLYTMSQAPLR